MKRREEKVERRDVGRIGCEAILSKSSLGGNQKEE